MECPKVLAQWKTYTKRKLSTVEVLDTLEQVVSGLNYLHEQGYTHRDVHPSRIQQFSNGVVKFNTIGLPYNFKKLLKRDDFSGHINYSAPELILEKVEFTNKVDIWALGCALYFIIHKKDPFDGRDPVEIKKKILSFKLL
jgi:serine/threonine protein kinase